MKKSVFTSEHKLLTKMLREARERAKITQVELAEKLSITQAEVSKYELGDRRVDLIQLKSWCEATGASLTKFVREFERRL